MNFEHSLTTFARSSFAIILFSICMLAYQFSVGNVFHEYFGDLNQGTLTFLIFFVTYSFGGYLLITLSFSKFLSRENLAELGLALPKPRKTLVLTIAALICVVPITFYLAQQETIQNFYRPAGVNYLRFAFVNLILLPIYYFGEEFFFRGFLFFSLWKNIRWHSYWITELIFIWSHLGKPGLEILICIPVGCILNSLTLHTRSVYPAMFVHFVLGGLLNFLVAFVYLG